MTTISPQDNPWLGLLSYGYDDSARFYGRDRELTELSELIRQNPFTTIYGLSGAGKTSIINAGLIPILDKENYLPIYIRLVHGADRMAYDEQIIQAVRNALERIEAEEELIEETKIDSELDKLWLYFHTHQFWTKDNHKITPILFIDQFEEIFTKNEDVDDVWSFFNVIDSLQYNMPTERILQKLQENDNCVTFGEEMNFRVVFSMREDFLPRLEDYCFDIPAMRRNRVGLKPLNGAQALEVIMSPRPGLVSRDVALHIISKVIGKAVKDEPRRLEATLVDTSILSLFCTELYNYGKSGEGEVSITTSLVDLYGGNILEWFYDRSMQELPRKAYEYLEDHLLTHSGFRNSVALEDLLLNNLTRSQLDRLEENRIIRIEDVGHNLRVEFTHDILCKIAKKHRDERNQEARNKSEKEAKKLFTIDTAIFMTLFGINLFAAYWTWGSPQAFFALAILPFLAFFYLFFEHRALADKSFSQFLWITIGLVVLEICLGVAVNNMWGTGLYDILRRLSLALPLGIMCFPLVFNILESYGNFFRKRKRRTLFVLGFIVLMIAEGVPLVEFLYNWYFSAKLEKALVTTSQLPTILPLVLFALSPFITLGVNWRKRTRMQIMTAGYCAYGCLLVLLFLVTFWNTTYSETEAIFRNAGYLVSLSSGFTFFVLGVMILFYAVQYMRQPKEKSIREFYASVMEMQAFGRFTSFGIRFKTIGVIVLIHLVWILSTAYYDIVPFITLPLLALFVMHVISKEMKLAEKPLAYKRSLVSLIVLLMELMLAWQYITLSGRQYLIFALSLCLSVLIYLYLSKNETWKRNVRVQIHLILTSLFLAFVLPSLCVGYFILNPSLADVSRVWGGRITSGVPLLNFLTVKDAEGKVGIMDQTEVFIQPSYAKIEGECTLIPEFAKVAFPLRYGVLLSDFGLFKDNYGDQRVCYFAYETFDGKKGFIQQEEFLTTQNSYASIFVEEWMEDYGVELVSNYLLDATYDEEVPSEDGLEAYEEYLLSKSVMEHKNRGINENPPLYRIMLSKGNVNISSKEKSNAIVRLFIKDIICYDLDSPFGNEDYCNRFQYAGASTLSVHDYVDEEDYPILRLWQKCYNDASLQPLIDNKNHNLKLRMLERAEREGSELLSFPDATELKRQIEALKPTLE